MIADTDSAKAATAVESLTKQEQREKGYVLLVEADLQHQHAVSNRG